MGERLGTLGRRRRSRGATPASSGLPGTRSRSRSRRSRSRSPPARHIKLERERSRAASSHTQRGERPVSSTRPPPGGPPPAAPAPASEAPTDAANAGTSPGRGSGGAPFPPEPYRPALARTPGADFHFYADDLGILPWLFEDTSRCTAVYLAGRSLGHGAVESEAVARGGRYVPLPPIPTVFPRAYALFPTHAQLLEYLRSLPAPAPFLVRPSATQALALGSAGPYRRRVLPVIRGLALAEAVPVKWMEFRGPDALGLYAFAGQGGQFSARVMPALHSHLEHLLGG